MKMFKNLIRSRISEIIVGLVRDSAGVLFAKVARMVLMFPHLAIIVLSNLTVHG